MAVSAQVAAFATRVNEKKENPITRATIKIFVPKKMLFLENAIPGGTTLNNFEKFTNFSKLLDIFMIFTITIILFSKLFPRAETKNYF
ncbi:MAG: hypothetical protein A3G09_00060 [Candidatus Moranbacteria bacterium RIFCSPLOWO2_12_FULL_48_12]|nr:MAG: hypothetical protein A3G09_00060 [Candidatus Moranbacteria bacterium RIFCSPLOWO2_12_FULL_48_12]